MKQKFLTLLLAGISALTFGLASCQPKTAMAQDNEIAYVTEMDEEARQDNGRHKSAQLAPVTLNTFNEKLNAFKKNRYANNSIYKDNPSATGGEQCFGFANELAKYIFGSYPTKSMSAKTVNKGWTCTYGGAAIDNLCIGDIVRYGYHSIFITGIHENMIYYCQANFPAKTNKVTYDNTITKAKLKAKVSKRLTSPNTTKPGWVAHFNASQIEIPNALTINYHANGGEINDATVENQYTVTVDEGLNVRATAGTSGTKLGALTKGKTVKILETKTLSDYTWGKISFQNTFGWIALNSAWVSKAQHRYYLKDSYVYDKTTSAIHKQTCTYGVQTSSGLYNDETFLLSRDGYTFKGWSLSPTGKNVIDQNYKFKPEEIVPELKNGNQQVTVYAVWEVNAPVITDPTVENIYVASKPQKNVYQVGDTLDMSAIRLYVTHSDGEIEQISEGFTCSPTTLSTEGTQTITVTYEGVTASFNVQVTATKTRANNATAKNNSVGYLFPHTSAKTLKNQGVWKNDTLQVLCKDGDFYLCLIPWGATSTTKTNGVLLYIQASDIQLNTSVSVPDASAYYSFSQGEQNNATVLTDTKLYYKPDGGANPISYNGTVIDGQPVAADTSVRILFELDGYYCVRTTEYTGFVAKNTVSLDESVCNITPNTASISVKAGENADLDDVTLQATFTDGTTKTVSPTQILYPDTSVVGNTYAVLSYGDLSASVPVTVETAKIQSITVTQAPNNSLFIVGEELNMEGMIITATYDNGNTADITQHVNLQYTFEESGFSIIEICYEDSVTYLPVTVYEKPEIEIFNTEGFVGQIVSVPVAYFSSDEHIGATAFSITLSYPSDTLTFVGIDNSELDDTSVFTVTSEENRLTIAYNGTQTMTNNCILFDLQFTVTGNPSTGDTEELSVNVDSFTLTDNLGNHFETLTNGGFIVNMGQVTLSLFSDTTSNAFAVLKGNYGTSTPIPNNIPSMEGYSFMGWATASDAETPTYVVGDQVEYTENISLYAVWEEKTESDCVLPEQSETDETNSQKKPSSDGGCNATADYACLWAVLSFLGVAIYRKKKHDA